MSDRTPTGHAPLVAWAAASGERLLAPLGNRWRHVQAVAAKAARIAPILAPSERPVFVAAAYLHDVGRAPELAETGFHPLDGARWLRGQGRERLAGLVAHHSGARFEAAERGLGEALDQFERERTPTADALTYCDVTTDPTGHTVTPEERWAEVERRYGPQHVAVAAHRAARDELLAEVRRTEALLARTPL